jgi:hypothetical protein
VWSGAKKLASTTDSQHINNSMSTHAATVQSPAALQQSHRAGSLPERERR